MAITPFWGFLLAKLLVAVLAFAVAGHLLALRAVGKKLAIFRVTGGEGTLEYQRALDDKRSKWSCLTANLLLALFVVEVLVRSRLAGRYSPLFFVHLPAAAAFLVLVLALRFLPGHRSRRFHRAAGWTALALFLFAFVTGGIMLIQL